MRILVTGGCGNLGAHAVRACLAAGHTVRVLELPSRAARRTAATFGPGVEVVWGDLVEQALDATIAGCGAVIHTAALLWPATEGAPALARRVNVDGTQRLLEACATSAEAPAFVYTSSIGVFGHTQAQDPPRRSTDPVVPTDVYTETKVAAEALVRASGLRWVILRVGAALPVEPSFDPREARLQLTRVRQLFRTRADNRIEFVHPADVGTALCRAAVTPEAAQKTLLIGGGAENRFRVLDLTNEVFEVMGLGRFPATAFGSDELYTDWLDSEEAERILGFQSRTLGDYLVDSRAALGRIPAVVRPAAPVLRRLLSASQR